MLPALTDPTLFRAPAATARPPDLIAEGLVCRRGERLVFAGLSFRLSAGGALILTGANGSGRRACCGLCRDCWRQRPGGYRGGQYRRRPISPRTMRSSITSATSMR